MTNFSDDGTFYALLELCDADHGVRPALATCREFAEIDFLWLLCGIEISLDPASRGMVVLPLAQQNPAVIQHLLDQLLSPLRRALEENRDPSDEAESLVALLQQLISSR